MWSIFASMQCATMHLSWRYLYVTLWPVQLKNAYTTDLLSTDTELHLIRCCQRIKRISVQIWTYLQVPVPCRCVPLHGRTCCREIRESCTYDPWSLPRAWTYLRNRGAIKSYKKWIYERKQMLNHIHLIYCCSTFNSVLWYTFLKHKHKF